VFSLAHDIVNSLSDNSSSLLDFMEFLRVHVLELVRIHPQKCYRLFRHNRYDESKLLRELRKHPEQRFQLLTAIIRETAEQNEEQSTQSPTKICNIL